MFLYTGGPLRGSSGLLFRMKGSEVLLLGVGHSLQGVPCIDRLRGDPATVVDIGGVLSWAGHATTSISSRALLAWGDITTSNSGQEELEIYLPVSINWGSISWVEEAYCFGRILGSLIFRKFHNTDLSRTGSFQSVPWKPGQAVLTLTRSKSQGFASVPGLPDICEKGPWGSRTRT